MKAIVDKETCTGCGLCSDNCADVFEMVEDIAVVKGDEVPAGSEECAKQAAEDCPVESISIQE